uniref:G-protein coupled receptors family 1 profile domain-containing protein n=1 Tax=Glossina pallidipes TaxID=7398 RepID=A0A1B0A0B7_GLOPL
MSEFSFFTIMDFEYAYNQSSANAIHLPSMTPSFQPTHHTNIDEMSYELNIPYTIFEILVAICAIIGNLMVIIVFQRERKLRRRTNYYIVSLAMADFLVGSLGVPFAILASIGLPTNLYACLFTVSLLVVLCTISIFCLVAVSVDRYWAILYPMAYSRNVRTRTAIVIISMCWFAGTVVGFLPLFGWHAVQDEQNHACLFVEVMDYNYLVFLYVATIITPALLMLAFYAHIYKVIIKQVRQIVTMNPKSVNSRGSSTVPDQKQKQPSRSCHGGTMLRVLGAARKRDVKATQNLSIIVLFFMICWIPLYTINCIKAFCPNCDVHPKLTLFCIILSHLNSAVNPVLYAYHLKDFRLALKNLILKILGIEVEQPMDTIHRYSLASQHRLQSLDVSGRNTQTRIYIDSPVWLRQQQEQASKNSQLVKRMTPCLNNIPQQTVAVAVASVTSDIEKQMWNIMEVSSNAEINDTDLPSTPKGHHHVTASISVGCNSHYSYENHNFSSSADDSEFEEVFLPQSHDTKQFQQAIHSHSDYEIINKNNRQNPSTKIQYVTPPLTPKQIQQVHENRANPIQNSFASSSSSSSNGYSSVFIIDSDCKPISPGHKPKFKASSKSFNKSINLNSKKSLRHSCSWTSDNSCTASKDALQIAVPNYKSTDVSPPPPPPLSSHSNSSRSSLSAVLGFSSNPSPSLSTELSLICNSHHVNQTNNNNNNSNNNSNSKNNNNNSGTNNSNHNLNYYTFHYPQSSTKFSPFKAINNLLLPPIVRHSSLFHLFHNSNGHLNETSSSNSNNSTSTTIAAQSMTDSSNKSQSETNHIIDSAMSAINADLIESSTAMQIHSVDSQIVK